MNRSLLLTIALHATLGLTSPIITNDGTINTPSTPPTSHGFSTLSSNTATINGVLYPPGSEPSPGTFVTDANTPICYAYCLNPKLPATYQTRCAGQGCPNSTINKNAYYVLQDNRASYKGDRLRACFDGQVCADIRKVVVDLRPFDYPA